MKKAGLIIAIIVILAAVVAIFYFTEEPEPESSLPKISATIFPLYDIVQNISGDKIHVQLIAPPGASPHTFEVTAEQVRELQGSKILFSLGHGVDAWISQVKNALPESEIYIVSDNIQLQEFENEHQHVEHSFEGVDPHYWLSIPNAKIIAKNITEKLKQFDPENSAYYQNNVQEYYKKLDQADQQIHALLDNVSSNEIITLHQAWSYFSHEYGLEIVATFEPYAGEEPSPQHLVELSNLTKEYNIKTIFSEPQLSNQLIKPFLSDLDLDLKVLDPLGGQDERDSYINMMLYNAQTLYEALK